MKKTRITRVSPGHDLEDQTDWTRVKKMTPEDIRTGVDSDCPTTEPGDWDQAVVKSGVRGPKPSVRKNTEVKVRFGSLEEKIRSCHLSTSSIPNCRSMPFLRWLLVRRSSGSLHSSVLQQESPPSIPSRRSIP